jgi:putative nucleotidyltransferase with HDIG domain
MRLALSDHKDFYHKVKDSIFGEGATGQGEEYQNSIVIGDGDISGLRLVDFGSILGISLLSNDEYSQESSRLAPGGTAPAAELKGDITASEKSYFARHSRHVAEYSLAVANAMRLPMHERKAIYVAGFLHDIGKLQISSSILYKEGPLSSDEYESMKMHPILAMNMLSGVSFPWSVKPLILHHHERCDGSGYPEGLTQDEIPLGARIIAVADFVDAYSSTRLYEKAHSLDELIQSIVMYSGTIFDEAVCIALVGMIESGVITIFRDSEVEEETVSESRSVLPAPDSEGNLD